LTNRSRSDPRKQRCAPLLKPLNGDVWRMTVTSFPFGDSRWWFLKRCAYETEHLEIEITEGIVAQDAEDIEIAGRVLSGSRRIEVTPASRQFRLTFPDALAVRIVSESYARPDRHGEPATHPLRRYEQSEFLDHVRSSTLLESLRSGEFRHYGLVLADDVIDIVTLGEPAIEAL
ncbi:MAG: hypothetical protein ACRD1B_00400, partial [Thermoanaerobaculia bacterium]